MNLLVVLRICAALFMIGSLMGAGLAVAPRDALVPLKHGRFVVLSLVFGWLVGPLLPRQANPNHRVPMIGSRFCPVHERDVLTAPTEPLALADAPKR